MTPKEKAEELFDKYWLVDSDECSAPYTDKSMAKKCALIAVDEILNTGTLEVRYCGYVKLCEKHIEFWQEVKQTIQEL